MQIKPKRYFAKDGDSGGAATQPNQPDNGQGGANTPADESGTTPGTSAEKTSEGPPDWFMAKLDDPKEAWKVIEDIRNESKTWRQKYGDAARQLEERGSEREPEPKPTAAKPEPEPQPTTNTGEIDRLKAELDRERKQRELDALKLQIGEEMGLSVTLAKRLNGDSADSIRQDAEQVLKAVKPQQPDAGRRRTTQTPGGSPAGESDADRRARLFGGNTGRRVFTNRGN